MDREEALHGARAVAEPAAWECAWHAGEVLKLEGAIAYGLGEGT